MSTFLIKSVVTSSLLTFSLSALAAPSINPAKATFFVYADQGKVIQSAKDKNIYHLVLQKPQLTYLIYPPIEKAGGLKPAWIVKNWSNGGKNSFAKNPPSAALIAGTGKSKARFFILNNPQYNQSMATLSFKITSMKDEPITISGKPLNKVGLVIKSGAVTK
jgi:hypothetical protein